MSASPSPPPRVVVVMGVAGSGKSTVGRLLAERWSGGFEDGDDLHTASHRAKMAAGHPLTDADRMPWLEAVRSWIDTWIAQQTGPSGQGRVAVVACSALRRRYRDVLRRPDVAFVLLHGSRDVLAGRLEARRGHFMPPRLLDSQLATLEPPLPDERAVRIDIALPLQQQLDDIAAALGLP